MLVNYARAVGTEIKYAKRRSHASDERSRSRMQSARSAWSWLMTSLATAKAASLPFKPERRKRSTASVSVSRQGLSLRLTDRWPALIGVGARPATQHTISPLHLIEMQTEAPPQDAIRSGLNQFPGIGCHKVPERKNVVEVRQSQGFDEAKSNQWFRAARDR